MLNLVPFRQRDFAPTLFGRSFDRFFEDALVSWDRPLAERRTPVVTVNEGATEYVARVEVPGFSHQDIRVILEGDVLRLEGQHASSEDGTETERAAALAFTHSLSLGTKVDTKKVSAELKDGVLTVTLPKHAESLPRQIKVRAA